MKLMAGLFGAFIALVVAIFGFIIIVRNGLIAHDEAVKANWAEIDNQLQRRADLIPNLVNTVKGYAQHEKGIFESVSEARSKMLAAKGPAEKSAAYDLMNQSLGRLLAVAENYPQLKADNVFIRLQDELAGTENRIAVARGRYNNAVKDFNQAIRKFPGALFAGSMGFSKAEYFQVQDRAKATTPPEVKF